MLDLRCAVVLPSSLADRAAARVWSLSRAVSVLCERPACVTGRGSRPRPVVPVSPRVRFSIRIRIRSERCCLATVRLGILVTHWQPTKNADFSHTSTSRQETVTNGVNGDG